jgi:hypothetical protein
MTQLDEQAVAQDLADQEGGAQRTAQTGVESAAPRPLVTVTALVRGVDVELRNAVAGAIVAGDDVRLERGGARSIFAGGNLTISQGGAGLVVAGGDTSISKGGAQAVISAGSVMMESAGSGIAVARRIRIGRNGMTVFALTPQLDVQEGGRVIFGRSAAFAMLGGFAGLGLLLAGLLRRRRG